MRTDRLARALVRLYPRAWRARYEVEFVRLLDETRSSWSLVLDIARGAAVEQLRQSLRLIANPAGTADPELPLPHGRAFVIGVVWLSVGWLAGLQLGPFIADDWFPIQWLPILALQFLEPGFRGGDVPILPVYVVHPWRPGRILQLRAPGWMRIIIDTVFFFVIIPKRLLSRASILGGRRIAVACLVCYGIVAAGAPYVVRLGPTAEFNMAWITTVMVMSAWMAAVGRIFVNPADDPRVAR
jgi:hypothetical protein